jgi:hypothetical protein
MSDQQKNKDHQKLTSHTTKAGLTGAAWADQPMKADGMTLAEEQTNRTAGMKSDSK